MQYMSFLEGGCDFSLSFPKRTHPAALVITQRFIVAQ